MIVRHGFAPRAAGLTPAEAQAHWKSTHADLAVAIPGLRRYVQNHAVLALDGRPLLPWPGFDVYSETEFDSLDSMAAGFASEHYQVRVRADETVLIDKSRFQHVECERRVVADGEGRFKLIAWFRLRAGVAVGDLAAALAAAGGPGRHEVHLPVVPDPAFDAADERWFQTAAAAVDAVRGDLYAGVAGLALGAAMTVAEPRLVMDGTARTI